MWRQGSLIIYCFTVPVMLRHVLHVTITNSSLASVQLFALPCIENGVSEKNCCGVVRKHKELMLKPLLFSASRRCSKPVWVLIIQCPFSLNVDLYSCSCISFLSGFSWPHAAAQSQINKDLCWQLLQKLLASFKDIFFFPCVQGVGCRRLSISSGVCFPVQSWPLVLGESVCFAFLCKLTAARIGFCLLLMCGYWTIEKEMSSVVFYQSRLCLGLFLNLTCALKTALKPCLKVCSLHSSHHDSVY